MLVRKFGHSCLLVEDNDARVLVDPGSFSSGLDGVDGLSAVLVTHAHADHLDLDRVESLLESNPEARIVCDEGSAMPLRDRGFPCEVVRHGDELDVGMKLRIFGEWHAVIHPDIPVLRNVGYLLADRLFHPGDSFTDPEVDVEVLAVPAGAPWMLIAEAIDYTRQVKPKLAIPIHDCVLANPASSFRMLEQLAPAATTVRVIGTDETLDLGTGG